MGVWNDHIRELCPSTPSLKSSHGDYKGAHFSPEALRRDERLPSPSSDHPRRNSVIFVPIEKYPRHDAKNAEPEGVVSTVLGKGSGSSSNDARYY